MLIPALDLINGEVVRLQQGDFARQTTYSSNPLTLVEAYEKAGAEWLHLVDLDGARDTSQRQLALLKTITANTTMNVQVGGGIRNQADLEQLYAAGVQRAVVGSVAVREPRLVQQWLQEFGPDAIVLALDVNIDSNGVAYVATHGWQETSTTTLTELIDSYLPYGLRHVLCTDISRDGMLTGTNVALYQQLKQLYPQLQLQASGGVASLDDLEALQAINCDSVILGKALLTGKFTLTEALQCWPNA
ncbi:1-(5-phosphoribosyl)-5-[(5-phosphoribosylamino)methylideneamino]imidazole-4-carboxamide isomerase [Pseudidiomarina andamanensis]|uniref:1-(5-phosphoribosyl)-5-[(5-phosphoribosylamino)methylideneamino] imidazole-4-carboxamide isomerase n=1 Tax=Pseudidiomarina andamanensis TaxID=1940690 RepID=A0AA92EQA2_9GAMM|nr:1-(5-phosphoribosyl)-5-[(5-phosphoribosylamino)methylideneamino]imidazole-4-carboxamide isomerase [Pseudidiomarina andamanensis]MDS0218053.1 1-(5-phosphoribosyl)-5-[(5-phosphoribosylamino)methylideneamino]imidazole-4-carboxamide isomerase [Pseudidiomarina andamanensis]QGT94942.1 1-(5-phosphoribosyl)-5-[(5-phosphoribosylamino)methylideneamino]imidazole-4-carboxamide isomerase [Pseudidiomarina andamanensis]